MPPLIRTFGPGRVNLIGEHTDYNGGLALPFAIDRGVWVEAEPLDDPVVHAEALDLGETDSFPLDRPEPVKGWRAFVRGTAAELQAAGVELRGTRLRFHGDVPRGSGLSSSAALEAALCLALLARRRGARARPHRARGAVLAGGERLGGRRDRAAGPARVAARTRGPRPADRLHHARAGARAARARRLAARHRRVGRRPQPRGLGLQRAPGGVPRRVRGARRPDASARPTPTRPPPCPRRSTAARATCLSENARVDATVAALRAGDLEEVGRLLDASHASLRDDYEASVPAVEDTVAALEAAGAAGARMVGGGFGGSVLGLLRPGAPLPGGCRRRRAGPAGARALTPGGRATPRCAPRPAPRRSAARRPCPSAPT